MIELFSKVNTRPSQNGKISFLVSSFRISLTDLDYVVNFMVLDIYD